MFLYLWFAWNYEHYGNLRETARWRTSKKIRTRRTRTQWRRKTARTEQIEEKDDFFTGRGGSGSRSSGGKESPNSSGGTSK